MVVNARVRMDIREDVEKVRRLPTWRGRRRVGNKEMGPATRWQQRLHDGAKSEEWDRRGTGRNFNVITPMFHTYAYDQPEKNPIISWDQRNSVYHLISLSNKNGGKML
jgi:hypothetical protein